MTSPAPITQEEHGALSSVREVYNWLRVWSGRWAQLIALLRKARAERWTGTVALEVSLRGGDPHDVQITSRLRHP